MSERVFTFGELCAGVGGMSRGLEQAGMRPRWLVEWDRAAAGVLALHHPGIPIHFDLNLFKPTDDDSVDLIAGGTPCQNLSVAGNRKGLDGEQSRTFYQMVRVCKRLRARRILWENVAGALFSNDGRDFAAVLRAFTGAAVEVPADGWGDGGFVQAAFPCRWNVAWRVFDSQFFGVPQRRRRVFVVGSLGDASCVEILFEPESVRGDPPPSRGAGKGTPGGVEGGVAKCLAASDGGIDREDRHTLIPELAACLQERDWRGCDSNTKPGHLIPDVMPPLLAQGNATGGDRPPGTTVDTVGHLLPVAFSCKDNGRDCMEDVSPTLRAMGHAGSHQNGGGQVAVAIPIQEVGKRTGVSTTDPRAGIGIGQDGDPQFTLQAGAQHGVAVAFKPSHFTREKDGAPSDVFPPLSADADKGDQEAVVFQTRIARNGRGQPEEVCPTLNGSDAGATSDMRPIVAGTSYGVRRLIPVECERLQAWPDGSTAKRAVLRCVDNRWVETGAIEDQADGPRYKQAGNGVTTSVALWIAKRILKFSQQ